VEHPPHSPASIMATLPPTMMAQQPFTAPAALMTMGGASEVERPLTSPSILRSFTAPEHHAVVPRVPSPRPQTAHPHSRSPSPFVGGSGGDGSSASETRGLGQSCSMPALTITKPQHPPSPVGSGSILGSPYSPVSPFLGEANVRLRRPIHPRTPELRLGAKRKGPGPLSSNSEATATRSGAGRGASAAGALGARAHFSRAGEYGRRLLMGKSKEAWSSEIEGTDYDWFCSVVSFAPKPPGGR
jgi:hypothetical protein